LALVLVAVLATAGFAQEPGTQQSAPPGGQPDAAQQARDLLDKGVAAYRDGRLDEAVADFQKAKELDPTSVKPRLYLAKAYAGQYIPGAPSDDNIRMGRQAIDEFKGVLTLDPDNLAAIDGLGSILYNMAAGPPFNPDTFKESAKYHSMHIQLKPDDPEPYFWLGVIDWTLVDHANRELRAEYNAEHPANQIHDDEPLPLEVRMKYVQEYGRIVDDGMAKLRKAIALRPDYDAAIPYLNLLYRQKAAQAVRIRLVQSPLVRQTGPTTGISSPSSVPESAEATQSQGDQQIAAPPQPPPPPPPPPATGGNSTGQPTRIRIGGNVHPPKLLSAPPPVYPMLARQARIQGDVVLNAVITKDGNVTDLRVISGHPLLVQAAMDAVRKWKYQTTLLDGNPVEVEMTITVHFALADHPPEQQSPPAEESPAPGSVVVPNVPTIPGGHTGDLGPVAIDPQLKADILHLFDVMKVRDLMGTAMKTMIEDVRPKLLASLPLTPNRDKIADSYIDKLTSLLKSDEFLDDGANVYAKYLSDDDIKALTAFFETPAGQHYNAVSSKIFSESAQVGEQVTRENMPRILKELCDEYPELRGEANFCPKIEPGQGNQSLLREPTGEDLGHYGGGR
jgi:TonB family protein